MTTPDPAPEEWQQDWVELTGTVDGTGVSGTFYRELRRHQHPQRRPVLLLPDDVTRLGRPCGGAAAAHEDSWSTVLAAAAVTYCPEYQM